MNTRLGLSGEALRDAAINALELSDALGVDATNLITKTAQAMRIFGENSADVVPIMDRLFVVSQQTGIGIDQLTGQLQQYGPVLRNAEFTTAEATAVFGNLNAAGIDASRVFPGLNRLLRDMASEGVLDLKGGLFDMIAEIENATEGSDALNRATEAFGAEGAQRLKIAIENGTFSLEAMIEAMANADGAVAINAESTRTLTERMAILRNRLTNMLSAFDRLPGALQLAILGFGGALAVLGPTLVILPQIVRSVQLLRVAFTVERLAQLASTAATVARTVATVAKPKPR